MANLAEFYIDSSPPAERGFDVAEGGHPVLRLAASSSLVKRVTFSVRDPLVPLSPRCTNGAPVLTLDNGSGSTGQSVDAATQSGQVTISGIPTTNSTAHLWMVTCTVNGGTDQFGAADPSLTFSRIIALRNPAGLRKILATERDEYDPDEYWASAVNDLLGEAGGVGADKFEASQASSGGSSLFILIPQAEHAAGVYLFSAWVSITTAPTAGMMQLSVVTDSGEINIGPPIGLTATGVVGALPIAHYSAASANCQIRITTTGLTGTLAATVRAMAL